jgi:O-antigen/teichoic acid export membrane protein
MGYARNIGHNLFTQILKISFGMLTGIVVARALGPSGQGYIAYLILIFTLLGNFGHWGITSAVSFFQKKSGFERMAVYSTNVNSLILLSLFYVILVVFLRSANLLLPAYGWPMVIGGLALSISYLFIGHHQAWLTGDERIILNNNIGLISFFLKSACILVLWLWGMLNVNNFFAITVLALLLWFILIQIKLKESFSFGIFIPVLKAELSYGTVAWAATLFTFLHYRADQIMIKQYLGSADLGIYSIAVTIAELLFLLPVSVSGALVGRLYNLGEQDDGRHTFSRTIRMSMSICLVLCLVGIPGSFLIPFVYGKPYSPATALMLVLLPGILFACLPKISSVWFFTTGRPKVHLRISLFCLLLNIALNFLFIPIWQSLGAALASSISYFFYGLYYLLMLTVREGFRFKDLLILQRKDIRLPERG